jgi:glucose-1-phosphate thymidylyltransferase
MLCTDAICWMKSMSNTVQCRQPRREVVGIVPAGGKATRLAPLPCSKELLPVGFSYLDDGCAFRPKVISHYLLETMRLANIKKTFIILRDGKWDIPSYYGDGKMLDMHLAYLMMDLPFGVPYTLDQAYPFIEDAIVALGFPDMIFQPENAFIKILAKQEESNADIVLGLFPAFRPHKTDMVELDEDGRVCSIQIKPDQTNLIYAWEIAVWTPAFSHFMHDYLLSLQKMIRENENDVHIKTQAELQISEVVQAAIQNKFQIETVVFKDGRSLDIGTTEDLIKAVQMGSTF